MLKLHNCLNELKTGDLTTKQQNLFISLMERLQKNKDKKNRRTAKFTFAELKTMADLKCRCNKRFYKSLDDMIDKILSSRHKVELQKGRKTIFNIFSKMEIDEINNVLYITVNKDFEHILFDVEDCYSKLNVEEYMNLKNNYSKILYRFINQWKGVGIKDIGLKEFREMFEVPTVYEVCHITQKILKPSIKEISLFFPGLSCEKIKNGKKIESLTFTWQIPERKKKADKFKKEKIQEAPVRKKSVHGEEELKKYEAEKRLADIIETNLDTKVITKENSNAKTVSAEQFEEMYRKYLKDNGINHARGIRLAFEQSVASKYKVAN